MRLVITYGADPRATGSPFHLAQSRWHGSLPRLGRSSPGTTVPRGEEEKFGASGRSRQQTGASGCSLAVGRAAKQGNRAPRAPPRDALPGPRPAHPTPFPRTQPAAAVRNRRSCLGEESRADFAPRTLGLGFPLRSWISRLASPSRSQSGAGWRDVPRKICGLRPRPGPTPARLGAEPGASGPSCSLPGAPESGRLLRLQPRERHLPPPRLPGASRALRAAPDAGSELAHQVRRAAGFLRLRLGSGGRVSES